MRPPTVTMNAPMTDKSGVLMRSAVPPGKMRHDSTKRELTWSGTCSAMMTAISASAMQTQKPYQQFGSLTMGCKFDSSL